MLQFPFGLLDLGMGFQGCLKDVYVGSTSLLYLLSQKDTSQVVARELATGCDLSVLNAQPEEIPDQPSETETVDDLEEDEIVEGPFPVGPAEGNCDDVNCENGGSCFINGMTFAPECECIDGYAGKFCQFCEC